ncbi:hypothetical protein [Acetohalobium arabaticum]|uniref:Uncharacterized protein n=1 Tax=Acetohalobium arabaticum (strain ATCC 49924 / DSM 5501 / Z-7288) TaxID=574087 RepID=D9QT99_ACEAZ|nr:hypothetical protein [Acetohalobium arabaticum]ADL13599.1 hypothetical protein Acear_2109 [Acetohalobium arabaticum DSM 5501]
MIDFIEADYQAGRLKNIKSGQLSYSILKKLFASIIPQIDLDKVGLVERINLQDKQYNTIRYIIKGHQGEVLTVKNYFPSNATGHKALA